MATVCVDQSRQTAATSCDFVSILEGEIGTMLNSLIVHAETVRAYGRISIALGEKMVKYASHVKYTSERASGSDNNLSHGDRERLCELSSPLGLFGGKAVRFGVRLTSQIADSRLAVIEDLYRCTKKHC